MELSKTDREQLFKVWDSVWNRHEQVGWLGLSEAEQIFYAVWHFESEVNSGGLESYYFNSGGDHALDATEALKRIGAPQLAAVLEEANGIFPGGPPPRDIDARQDRMDSIGDEVYDIWEEHDEKVFRRSEPSEELLWAFYKSNKEYFKES